MGKNWIVSLKKILPNQTVVYTNFSSKIMRKMGKGGAGWTLFLDVAGLLCCKKWPSEKRHRRKVILRLPVSKGQTAPNFLLWGKVCWALTEFAQGQVSLCSGSTKISSSIHAHTWGQHEPALPAPLLCSPTARPHQEHRLTLVKYISWCDARALTRYQTQISIQGKFF